MHEPHGLTGEQVLESFLTKKDGLTAEEAHLRQAKYGQNLGTKERSVSWFQILFRQFKSFIIYILLFADIISFFLGDHVEFYVITGIIAFIILLSFFEEYKATREMEALRKLAPQRTRVLRDGMEQEIDAADLVPGDIVLLKRGDVVPADARILEAVNLHVDESALTGESATVMKQEGVLRSETPLADRTNMLYASSHVMNGHARCVVTATGATTEIGKIASLVAGVKEEQTPLQKQLDRLGRQFSYGVIAVCIGIILIGLVRGQPWEGLLVLAVAVAVSGIPESLPAVIGVALAVGMKRMARQNALIKRLPAVETLGTCTVICTDKTGTLTQNKMVIEHVYLLGDELKVTGEGFRPEGLFFQNDVQIKPQSHSGLNKLIEIGTLCNNAELHEHKGEWRIEGESTEGALIVLAKKAGIDKVAFHKRHPRLHEHPFDADRKCMSTIHLINKKQVVYAKGAPELLLKKCAFVLQGTTIKKLTPLLQKQILAKNGDYAERGLRVLGLAYKEHKGVTRDLRTVEQGLIFVGLVSIRDPPEPSAKGSIAECEQAGIMVVMITGDNEITAKAIATELGIYHVGDRLLTGAELDKLDEDAFLDIVERITVYARVTPHHKLRIVETFQRAGHIVAMTGDGVNDAPALKKADIGIAMGRCGTEVAKEASEMVLLDDNFTTIVNAVREGRTIYDNIRKFVYYLLAGNFSEVILILIAALLGVLPPLTPVMILFINLVTSDIPAIGLCLEAPSANVMRQKPRNPKEGILNDYLFLKIGQVIPLIVLGTLALFMWEMTFRGGDLARAQTLAFATVIFFELFHVFNARSFEDTVLSRQMLSNFLLFAGCAVSAMLTFAVIYWAPLQGVMGTVALSLGDWLAILIMTGSVVAFAELQKTIISSEIKERAKMEIHSTRR